MPSEPFKPLVDPDFAKAASAEVIAVAAPLLEETVNHGSMAFQRCQVDAGTEKNIDLPAFLLYRHILELTDGAQVLVSNACSLALTPLLRAAFEASLFLEFLFESNVNYRDRALSWLCCNTHLRLEALERMDPETSRGTQAARSWEPSFQAWPEGHTAEERRSLTELFEGGQLAPIEAEYQRVRERRRYPAWYSLFDGPPSLAHLSAHLNRSVEYDCVYRGYSAFVHGVDLTEYTTSEGEQGVAFYGLRRPQQLAQYASYAIMLQLRATRLLVEYFRPGEDLSSWFYQEIGPRWVSLSPAEEETFELPG